MIGGCLRWAVSRRLYATVAIALLVGSTGLRAEEGAPRDPAQYLPQDTVLFVQIAPWKDWARDWDQTALAKIAQDAEMRAFLSGPFNKLGELLRELLTPKGAPEQPKAEKAVAPSAIASFFETLGTLAPGPAVVAMTYSQADVEAKRSPGAIVVLGTKDPTKFSTIAEALCNLFVKENVRQEQYGNASMFAVKYGDLNLGIVFLKSHIIVATRAELAKQVIDGIAGTAPKKLADSASYQACRIDGSAHNSVFLDMSALTALVGAKDKPGEKGLLDAAGLSDIQTVGWSMRMSGAAFETSAAVVAGKERGGWLSALDSQSIGADLLKSIRAGCPYVLGVRVRQDKLLPVVEELLKRLLSGDEFARFLAVKEKMGADKLAAELAQAFGTELAISSLSGPAGAPAGALSSDVGLLKVRDAAKAQELMAHLMRKVAAERGPEVKPDEALHVIESAGAKLMYLSPPPGFTGLSPVFGITADRLVVALDMQTLKMAVQEAKDSLTNADEFKRALQWSGGDLGALFVYLDYGQLYARSLSMFATAVKFLGSMVSLQKAGIDVNLLPTPEGIGKNLFPALVVVRATDRGLAISSRGPLPSPEVIVPPIAAAAAVVTTFVEQAGGEKKQP